MVDDDGTTGSDGAGTGKKRDKVKKVHKPTKYDLELLDAVEDNNDEEITALLSHGGNINAKSKTGETALHLAARYGFKTVVELLLDISKVHRGESGWKFTEIDAQDDDGWTALYGACINGYDEIAQVLLECGVKIDISARYGFTPLHKACQNDHGSVVEVLLNHGPDVEKGNVDGETALHVAARFGRTSMVDLLLRHDAKINALDNDGWTALFSATNSGHKGTVTVLIDHKIDVNAATSDGWTAFHKACHKGDKEILEAIINGGADLALKTSQGETSLHLASRHGQLAVIGLLLKNGVDVDARDMDGWTPLYSASVEGHAEIVDLLLGRHADIETRTKRSWTPLHAAAYKGRIEVVRILLKHAAAINTLTNENHTAMHLAGEEGHRIVILELLKHMDKAGKVAALEDAAAKGNYMVTFEILTDSYELVETKYANGPLLSIAAENGHWDVVRLLLELIPSTDFGNNRKVEEKALAWAAQNDEKMVCDLLSRKATHTKLYSYRVTNSWTALHWGAFHGLYLVVYWLLSNGASTAKRDLDGSTPRMVAENMCKMVSNEPRPPKTKDQNMSGVSKQQGKEKTREPVHDDGKDKEKTLPSSEDRYQLTLELLRNPPVIQGQPESVTLFRAPTLKKHSAQDTVCKEWDTTIIDFYVRNQRVDFLRRSRSVYDVIYKDGPEKIMLTAQRELYQIEKDVDPDKKTKQEADSDDDTETHSNSDSDDDNSDASDTTNSESSSRSSDNNNGTSGNHQFRWVHLPANNMTWMEDLLTRICLDNGMKKRDYYSLSKFLRYSSYELPGRASHSRLMKPACIKYPQKRGKARDRKGPGECELALYMPYLTFAKLPHNLDAEHNYDGYSSNTHVEKRHQALMLAYQEQVVHASQTLDQFYYHSLSNTDERDLDQVVTRYTEGTKRKDQWSNRVTILRVDQLWLWVVDDSTIITSSTHRKDDQEDPVLEGIFNYLREESGKGQGQSPPSSITSLSKFIANFCVGFIDQFTTEVRNTKESAQQIFAQSINEKAAEEARLFHNFTRKIDSKLSGRLFALENGQIKNPKGVNQIEQDHYAMDDEKMAATYALEAVKGTKERKLQRCSPYASISVAAHLLEEVKDIRDELNILKSLLKYQKTVWDDLFKGSLKSDRRRSPDNTIEEIEEMDRSAKRIQDSVNSLLGLDQNEANISEAQETTKQGRTLMIFTIVTIIFLPMSFLATLFTLNIASFPHESGVVLFEPQWIFPILFGTTIAISVPLIFFAFKAQSFFSLLQRRVSKVKPKLRRPLSARSPKSPGKPKDASPSSRKYGPPRSGMDSSTAEKGKPLDEGGERRISDDEPFLHFQRTSTSFWRDMRGRKGHRDGESEEAYV